MSFKICNIPLKKIVFNEHFASMADMAHIVHDNTEDLDLSKVLSNDQTALVLWTDLSEVKPEDIKSIKVTLPSHIKELRIFDYNDNLIGFDYNNCKLEHLWVTASKDSSQIMSFEIPKESTNSLKSIRLECVQLVDTLNLTALKKLDIHFGYRHRHINLDLFKFHFDKMSNLEYLEIFGSFKELTEDFSPLQKLSNLRIRCPLTTLPLSIAKLQKLTDLSIGTDAEPSETADPSPLAELPMWLDDLKSLEDLSIYNTSIESIPDLDLLKRLNSLTLAYNHDLYGFDFDKFLSESRAENPWFGDAYYSYSRDA